ncbi:xylulose kinase [Carex littledalei]|uniref:Xylulose kinase n=1 Tax=Carex littledalei TaxID=544730 RepID=A0A833QQQ7_9POAL|nr:xylulose kinase [Carex littledalei]
MGFAFPEDSLFLGFDSSTQSLKATVLDGDLTLVTSQTVHFDSELSHYKTKDGVYRDPEEDGRIVSPTLMWVEALDLMLEKLKSKVDFTKITAISGSGQQHGSVYWKKGSEATLSSLDHSEKLTPQLKDAFSIPESPVWMDSSTTKQCRELENAFEGAIELARVTGSCAYERYTGPQIKKIFENQRSVYENTDRISLVSSFMASILIGKYASIDETDGAGMNLMDIKSRVWSNIALEVEDLVSTTKSMKFYRLCQIRAIIEGQLLSMRGHAERFGMPSPPNRIIATGGASANASILKSIAQIFGSSVYTVQRPDSASLGAAVRAAHGWLCNKEGKFVPISQIYEGNQDKTALSSKLAVPAGETEADKVLLQKYTLLMKKRLDIERSLVEKFGRV